MMKLIKTLPVANVLGECPLWDEQGQAFWWTDIQERQLHRYRPSTDDLSRWATPERLCSFGFIEGAADAIVAAFESGFAVFHFETGDVDWLARPEHGVSGTRFNDGRVDRQGRFWSGTMVEDEDAAYADGNAVTGSVYRLDRGRAVRMVGDMKIINSICWSLDSRRQYVSDSPEHTIYVYDFDAGSGELRNRRVFARTEEPAKPDGSCIDAEDHLWNARWGGSDVVRYRPDGTIDQVVELPVTQPTCPCFGGPDLTWLAVTSATDELSESDRAAQPLAGALFLFETEFRGVPESRYLR